MSTQSSGDSNQSQSYIDFMNTPNYNLNITHPLIPNSQQYIPYNKYVSIHSEDRDPLKFPNSSEFEIELPEDILNVASIRLVNWTFPANYNTFSGVNGNILLFFKITNPYNPAAFGLSDDYNFKIYEALFMTQEQEYEFIIEDGFYNPNQMAIELTNKFNYITSQRILAYFLKNGWTDTINEFQSNGGYTRFIIVYNNVSSKLWFGNRADGFTIVNEVGSLTNNFLNSLCKVEKTYVPDASNYGLPSFLGLPRCNSEAISSSTLENLGNTQQYNGITVPRFYYGDVTPGDNGFWLLPYTDFSGSQVYWVESFYKINLMGEAFMYMEIEGQNCIDETQPFNVSKFTLTTNQTNGIVNSSFAKLGIPTAPLSQWFDRDSLPYKLYNPPAERIRRLRIKLRYHNGRLVDFGVFNYSFMLQFTLISPQILRTSRTIAYPPPIGR
jgi:hypothetical protein